jgi:hypothetical protein
MLNTSSGRLLFFKLRIVVAKEGAEEAPVIFYVRISRPRKTIRVETVTVRLIVLFIPWIVDQEGV